MPIILTLFFLSLSGIIFMIGSKLILIQKEGKPNKERLLIQIPNLQEIKNLTAKNLNKIIFIILVVVIKISVKTNNFTKKILEKIKKKCLYLIKKLSSNTTKEKTEINKESSFFKKLSDYKNKIKRIKKKITQEEENK